VKTQVVKIILEKSSLGDITKLCISYDMIYLLTANRLTPSGSSTVHIYTQTIHRTTQLTPEQHN